MNEDKIEDTQSKDSINTGSDSDSQTEDNNLKELVEKEAEKNDEPKLVIGVKAKIQPKLELVKNPNAPSSQTETEDGSREGDESDDDDEEDESEEEESISDKPGVEEEEEKTDKNLGNQLSDQKKQDDINKKVNRGQQDGKQDGSKKGFLLDPQDSLEDEAGEDFAPGAEETEGKEDFESMEPETAEEKEEDKKKESQSDESAENKEEPSGDEPGDEESQDREGSPRKSSGDQQEENERHRQEAKEQEIKQKLDYVQEQIFLANQARQQAVARAQEENKEGGEKTTAVEDKADKFIMMVIIGIAAFKDSLDGLFIGFDLGIIGMLTTIPFAMMIISARFFKKNKKYNIIFYIALFTIVLLELFPVINLWPIFSGGLALFNYIEKGLELIDKTKAKFSPKNIAKKGFNKVKGKVKAGVGKVRDKMKS